MEIRFNPLTGISSILTKECVCPKEYRRNKFQSPDGDFVYSDCDSCKDLAECKKRFQSPDGDFVYSDIGLLVVAGVAFNQFQSPDGDFVYSDQRSPPG